MTKTEEGKLYYRNGKNSTEQMQLARGCFEQAINENDYDACVFLASMYRKGQVCERNLKKAIELNEKALKHCSKLSEGIEQIARRNLGAYYAFLSKDIFLDKSLDEKKRIKLSNKYLEKSERVWVKAIKLGEKGLNKYLCRCFYGRDAEKCYKYSNNALDEIDVDNLEEYVPILFMKAISYGDIINEKIKDKSSKKSKMKDSEFEMLKDVLEYDLNQYDDRKFSDYRTYVISSYIVDSRYIAFLDVESRLKYLLNKYMQDTLQDGKYESWLFKEYKDISNKIVNNFSQNIPDCFLDVEKYYVDYLGKKGKVDIQTINECLKILKKIEDNNVGTKNSYYVDYIDLEPIDMPSSFFFFYSYDFINHHKHIDSYEELYKEFGYDLNNINGYIEKRKNEIINKKQIVQMQKKIEQMQMYFVKQNDNFQRQNDEIIKEIQKFNESNKKNTEKLEWELYSIKNRL